MFSLPYLPWFKRGVILFVTQIENVHYFHAYLIIRGFFEAFLRTDNNNNIGQMASFMSQSNWVHSIVLHTKEISCRRRVEWSFRPPLSEFLPFLRIWSVWESNPPHHQPLLTSSHIWALCNTERPQLCMHRLPWGCLSCCRPSCGLCGLVKQTLDILKF